MRERLGLWKPSWRVCVALSVWAANFGSFLYILWSTSMTRVANELGEHPLDPKTCWTRDLARKGSIFFDWEVTTTEISIATFLFVIVAIVLQCIHLSKIAQKVHQEEGDLAVGGHASVLCKLTTRCPHGTRRLQRWWLLLRHQVLKQKVACRVIAALVLFMLSFLVYILRQSIFTRSGGFESTECAEDQPCVPTLSLQQPRCGTEGRECYTTDSKLQCSAPVVSCKDSITESSNEADLNIARGLQFYCSVDLHEMVPLCVDGRFTTINEKFRSKNGWIEEAFVTFVGLGKKQRLDWFLMADLLVQSTHHFSSRPIVVANFGTLTPAQWTPERFPNMILLHGGPMLPGLSFNHNKLRAALFCKVKVGIVLDADQWVNWGIDHFFARAANETTADYPYPIMPVHWLSKDPDSPNYGGSYIFKWRRSQTTPPQRTMRWGQAHPTFTYHALPFLAKWTAYIFAPAASGSPEWLRRQSKAGDENLLNMASWSEGLTKQWCKFDILSPASFEGYIEQSQRKSKVGQFADQKWFPCGIPLAFYTAHGGKNVNESYSMLRSVWNLPPLPLIQYRSQWFASPESLHSYDQSLLCML